MNKILFISESYYPFQSGVPVVVRYLAEGLVSKGYNVTVTTSIEKETALSKTDTLNGVEIKRFALWRDVSKCIRGEINEIRQYVVSNHFDVIILECGQTVTTDVLLPVLNRINAQILIHAHGLSGLLVKPFEIKNDFKHTIGGTYNWFRMKWYYGHTFKKACLYIYASISLTDCDSGYHYLSKHIPNNYVLPNAADDLFFEQGAIAYNLPINKPYSISIANYTVVKNQVMMLQEYYKTKNHDHALVMIGSSPNNYYRKLIEEKKRLDYKFGHRDVLILTGIERKFFPFLLDNASLYLVTSTYEEYSISLIEAMSRGVPFISTNVGNAKDLPGGVTIEKTDDLHLVIDEMFDNKEELQKLSNAGKDFAYRNCRIQVAVENLIDIINKELQR